MSFRVLLAAPARSAGSRLPEETIVENRACGAVRLAAVAFAGPFAVDEGLQEVGALLDDVAQGRDRLMKLGRRRHGVRIGRGGVADLLRPAVDPPLNLRDVPLRERGRDRVDVLLLRRRI